jgi:hypothetical protein
MGMGGEQDLIERGSLSSECFDESRLTMTVDVAPPARRRIPVALAFAIEEIGTFGALEDGSRSQMWEWA